MKKTISVCIFSYNYAHLLAHCIESVLCQTRKADKIYVIDDGAHDGVDKVLEKYKGYNITPILREKNLGIVDNFQDVLQRLDTTHAMMLGADNFIHPHTLEILEQNDADIVSYDIILFGTEAESFSRKVRTCKKVNGYIVWQFSKDNINVRNYIHGSSLYNVELAKKYGYKKNKNSRLSEEDYMLWKAMILQGEATHLHVKKPLLYYRRHKNNFQRY
mgnify:CR=1 FL=1|tara:strand:- start:1030 stop:1680 length:651 start_codon:yes stop_codon:yes gene_type:complete